MQFNMEKTSLPNSSTEHQSGPFIGQRSTNCYQALESSASGQVTPHKYVQELSLFCPICQKREDMYRCKSCSIVVHSDCLDKGFNTCCVTPLTTQSAQESAQERPAESLEMSDNSIPVSTSSATPSITEAPVQNRQIRYLCCYVCQEKVRAVSLTCYEEHMLHRKCLVNFLDVHEGSKCPYCRVPLEIPNLRNQLRQDEIENGVEHGVGGTGEEEEEEGYVTEPLQPRVGYVLPIQADLAQMYGEDDLPEGSLC